MTIPTLAATQSSSKDDAARSYPVQHGLAGSSPTPGFAADSPLMMTGYPRIRPSLICPPEGGMGAEEAKVAGVVVTLMGPAPLGGDVRKRMDFQVKSRSPNSEARRAMLIMWLVPLGSGPIVSPTIVITTRILISCPW